MTIEIPPPFASDIAERHGRAGRRWLHRLPREVADLCDDWRLRPDGPCWWGYCAIAQPVRRRDGTPAVLKVTWPGPDQAPEALALRAWNGNGAVRLLDDDSGRWALLLERLDETRDLAGEPLDEAIQTVGTLITQLHGSPPPPEIPNLADLTRRWAEEIRSQWAAADPPWPDRVRDEVVATCLELGDGVEPRLLHVDLHFENVLAADRQPWLAIDPKGLAGDPAFESWPVLWNRVQEYAGRHDPARRLDAWCEAANVDRDRARSWARVRTVEDAVDRLVTATGAERDIGAHRFLVDALPE